MALEPVQLADPLDVYAAYSGAWNTHDAVERERELRRVWADEGVYVDDEVPEGLRGAGALLRYIEASHAEMPCLVVANATVPTSRGLYVSQTGIICTIRSDASAFGSSMSR